MSLPDLNALIQRAYQHLRGNQLPEAESICRQILAQQEDQPGALHLLAIICAKQGRRESSLQLFRQAVAVRPDSAEINYDFANALQNAGQLDEAIQVYLRAIALNGGIAEAHNNLGVALRENGRPDQAVAAFRHAIALKPQDVRAHINLGNALKDQRQFTDSIAALRYAIDLKPTSAEAYSNLSVCLRDAGQLEQSLVACQRAIALQPDLADAHNNLGVLFADTGKFTEAADSYRRAIALNPVYAQAFYNLGNTLKAEGRLDEAISNYRRAIAIRPSFVEADNNLVYTIHFHPAYDAKQIGDEHRRWNRTHADRLKTKIQSHTNDRSSDRRLRIGYVSPDLREHPVGRFLLPLLTNHDKARFEIFAYTDVTSTDEVTAQLRAHVEHWQTTLGLSDTQIADLIRHDQIDILVDLTMHMAGNRLLVFARKPAPVQVTWLAYCSTTGLEAIDYRLSDPYLDPRGMDESVYTEHTLRLPECYWCYQPVSGAAWVAPVPALANRFVTFGCLNNFAKVNDGVLTAWAAVLHAVAESRLVLRATEGSARQNVMDRMEREGIDARRIEFTERTSLLNYLEIYHRIDIALDTFPYSGGTITCDALWMGVPVISLLGQTAVGRSGSSILSNIGLSELVTRSEQDYVHLATELAGDTDRLVYLRSCLREKMQTSPLMNAPSFARNMEAAYRQMWRRWCTG